MIRYIHITAQLLAILVIRLTHTLAVRRHYHFSSYPSVQLPGSHVVIVANHCRAVDPFLICSFLPLSHILRLLPFCFMTHNGFYDSKLRPVLWIFGCFPARNPSNLPYSYGTEGAIRQIAKGYTLLIFPEGTRVKNETGVRAKKGLETIRDTFDKPLRYVLAKVEYRAGREYLTYDVLPLGLRPSVEDIMNRIYALPTKSDARELSETF